MELNVQRKDCVILVSAATATLHAQSSEGEVLWEVMLTSGRHDGNIYTELLGDGEQLAISDGTIFYREKPVTGLRRVNRFLNAGRPEGQFESGANPDFISTSSTQAAVDMRKQVRKAQLATKELNRAMEEQRRFKDELAQAQEAEERDRKAEEAEEQERQRKRKLAEAENNDEQA